MEVWHGYDWNCAFGVGIHTWSKSDDTRKKHGNSRRIRHSWNVQDLGYSQVSHRHSPGFTNAARRNRTWSDFGKSTMETSQKLPFKHHALKFIKTVLCWLPSHLLHFSKEKPCKQNKTIGPNHQNPCAQGTMTNTWFCVPYCPSLHHFGTQGSKTKVSFTIILQPWTLVGTSNTTQSLSWNVTCAVSSEDLTAPSLLAIDST